MSNFLDLARAKLSAAPSLACVFWIDLEQVLSQRNGGGLIDAERQVLTDENGREWQVVRHRTNPFPARRYLADENQRTVVWCVGMPGDSVIDMTAFEDYFSRTSHVLDVSLASVAEEKYPNLDLPRALGRSLAGARFDVDDFLAALAARRSPITMASAINVLASLLTGRDDAVISSSPPAAVVSVAVSLASASDENVVGIVRKAASAAAETNVRLKPLLQLLATADPQDIVAMAYVAGGLARMKVANIGSALVSDGWCPQELRTSYEACGGLWNGFADAATEAELRILAARFEPGLTGTRLGRLRDTLTYSAVPLSVAADEPLSAVRIAAVSARFGEFCAGSFQASGPGLVSTRWSEELRGFDSVARGIRSAESASHAVSDATETGNYARAFTESAVSILHLSIARASYDFRTIEHLLSPNEAKQVASRLAASLQRADQILDAWDEAWVSLLSRDVGGFLRHPRQGWRMSRDFADGGSKRTSWLLVFDGLRYDMWKAILGPAIAGAGWRLPESDMSFSYLPSVTEVSRRTLIAGSPDGARGQEETNAQLLANRADAKLTFQVRTESFDKAIEDIGGWNVRVFSWPDKLVHTDVADLGTLAAQFEKWVHSEFISWLQTNVAADSRVAIATDHGFAELADDGAVQVGASGTDDRNLPRVVPGAQDVGTAGLVVPDGASQATVATSRRWFKGPGARRWRFAHGGCTLLEVVTPFAELTPIREGVAEVTFEGLPEKLEIEEGEERQLEFRVRVTGGTVMFPSLTVIGLEKPFKKDITRDELVPISVAIRGSEGLTQIIVRVVSGTERLERKVPIIVKLAKLKRAKLDFDI